MKTNKIFLILALVSATLMTSCDFLNSDNKSTVTADNHFTTESSWNQLLVQAYFKLRSVYNNPMLYCAGTDLYTTSQGNAPSVVHTYQYTADEPQVEDLYKGTYAAINAANCVIRYSSNDKLNDEARFVRNLGYYILTQQFGSVPYIKEYIESAATEYPKTALAEIYSGMITDLEDVIAQNRLDNMPNYSMGAGHASILACKALLAKVYLAAAWDLDTELVNAEQGTYNVKSNTRFVKAGDLAKDVAAAVPLTQSFEEKWDFARNESGLNNENLFAVQYDRATSSNQANGGHSQQHFFGGYMGSNTLGVKAMRNDLCPTERVYLGFEPSDDRFEATFMTTIYAYNGNTDDWNKQGYWGYWNKSINHDALAISWKFFPYHVSDSEIESYLAANATRFVTTGMKQPTKVIRLGDEVKCWAYAADGSVDANNTKTMTFANALSTIGYLAPVKKFDDANTPSTVAQSGGDYRDFIVLDASEIYLTGAEAYLMAGGNENEALALLNAVRTRAHASTLSSLDAYKRYDWGTDSQVGVGSTDSEGATITKIDVILDERMRETLGQQYRWMDLKRTKQLVRYNILYCEQTLAGMTGNDGCIKWLRPIPTNEMQINTGIKEQNPGFGGVASAE